MNVNWIFEKREAKVGKPGKPSPSVLPNAGSFGRGMLGRVELLGFGFRGFRLGRSGLWEQDDEMSAVPLLSSERQNACGLPTTGQKLRRRFPHRLLHRAVGKAR